MGDFSKLKELYRAEAEILKQQREILIANEYYVGDIEERMSKIISFLEYCDLNHDTVLTLMQANQETKDTGLLLTEKEVKLQRDIKMERERHNANVASLSNYFKER